MTVHYQHKGPIGQYYMPKKPRFRLDAEKHLAESLVPNIEVIDSSYGGFIVERAKYILLRIDEKFYCIRAMPDVKRDLDGNQIFRFVNGNQMASNHIWYDVQMMRIFGGGNAIEFQKTECIRLTKQCNPITDLVMEYLSIDREHDINDVVQRIVFSDNEPITPKNYEVIHNG